MSDDTPWPGPGDEAQWRAVVAAGELGGCPPGLVVGALRALHVAGDPRVVRALALRASEEITRRLRRLIGRNHPNDGLDVIERAHGDLIASIFDPASSDGGELVEAFSARTRFRGLDAARVEGRYHRRHLPFTIDADGEPLISAKHRMDGGGRSIDVEHVLARIPDPVKRHAFRLRVEGMQIGAGDVCIARAVGCSPKTATAWIGEVRALLATRMGA